MAVIKAVSSKAGIGHAIDYVRGTVLNTRKVRLRRKSSSAIMARKGRENQPFFKRSKMCNKLY